MADAYAELRRLGQPVFTTREAAALWRSEQTSASRRLGSLEKAGLVRRVQRGLWALDPEIDPRVVGPYLTAPLPSYISLFSALSRHGMIEQIPRQISIVSTARPRRILTSLGVYLVHQISPPLFGGYEGTERSGFLAGPEKSLFDLVYVRAAAGSRAHLPELSLPLGFDRSELAHWSGRIGNRRLRTLVSRRLRELLSRVL
ncbi:MAG: type IV toxin-antitoxin system AbiEi family antitoxin domain-containing protein [Thermoleophilia bacterium]|nr:type IV toxin-antitoxin system AbiEi family antitoxin domain-containing protein [Thermoleophilia bacterium]